MSEHQNKKIFLQMFPLQIGLKKFLLLKKIKTLCRGHILLVTKKKLQKIIAKKKKKIKKSLEFKK